MGFFTDLKEDLSQAVNELMPEEEVREPGSVQTGVEAADELVPAADEFEAEEEIWAEKENWADESWADELPAEDVTIQDDMAEKLNSMLERLDEEEQDLLPEEGVAAAEYPEALYGETAAPADWPELTMPEEGAEPDLFSGFPEAAAEPEAAEMTETEPVMAAELTAETGPLELTEAEAALAAVPEEEPAAGVTETAEADQNLEHAEAEAAGEVINQEEKGMEELEREEAIEVMTEEMAGADMTEAAAVEESVSEENAAAEAAETETPSEPERIVSDEVAVVTAGMKIKGDMTSDGSMDVIGTVEGNIDIWGKLNISGKIVGNSKAMEVYAENARITGEITSEGSVKIGQSSVIMGNIYAQSAVIAGAVKGDIDVHGPVILDTTAIVMGNIKSKSVQINNGAVIEGMCSLCYADVNPTSFFEAFQ